ncbi:MAG: hypothetical protein ABSG82_00075 [Sedimentisphaerales bacterium]|jgi:hypothetical protein
MELYQDHCEVVKDSLEGVRGTDEQTYASVAVLGERLQRVRKLGQKFARVEFSPAVKRLIAHSSRVPVG